MIVYLPVSLPVLGRINCLIIGYVNLLAFVCVFVCMSICLFTCLYLNRSVCRYFCICLSVCIKVFSLYVCMLSLILHKPLTVYMSYNVLGRAYTCPSVLPLVVYPSTYITVRHFLPFYLSWSPDFGQSRHVCSWLTCCRWLFVAVV